MTRKHYIEFAAALKSAQPMCNAKDQANGDCDYSCIACERWLMCCNRIATVLRRDNARFDRSRFLAACGFKEV